jgi:hypothetical protein
MKEEKLQVVEKRVASCQGCLRRRNEYGLEGREVLMQERENAQLLDRDPVDTCKIEGGRIRFKGLSRGSYLLLIRTLKFEDHSGVANIALYSVR